MPVFVVGTSGVEGSLCHRQLRVVLNNHIVDFRVVNYFLYHSHSSWRGCEMADFIRWLVDGLACNICFDSVLMEMCIFDGLSSEGAGLS